MALALAAASVVAWCLHSAAGLPSSIIVGDVRVQLLSPLLFRVEPIGPQGFEDRNTFMVQNRDYPGLPFENKTNEDGSTKIQTASYTIILQALGGFMVFNTKGEEVYNTAKDGNTKKNMLHWPSPTKAAGYAVVDSPRFSVPEWTVSPCCPPGVEISDELKATNGYDFGNDVDGDTYVFILGEGLDGWNAAREEFASLTGPVPVLPDYSWGSWFTWWHFYDEGLAKWEVSNWTNHKVPLDVWGLDMNWRFTQGGQDQTYDHPNTSAFPDMGEWFGWLKKQGIHTYFNDHPFQKGPQTSPQEVGFRWAGLTNWLHSGLNFWWFDHNWKFSIGPPNGPAAGNHATFWKGLSTTAWGSHVYFEVINRYNRYSRPNDTFSGGRPIALSMTCPHNEISGNSLANPLHTGTWAPPIDPNIVAESPAHHRYPVHWNGDFVTMNNNLEMMVDAGVHDFKPYVHPDCGGDGWFKSVGNLLRQTQMCSFGTVLRYHGGPHEPWIYGGWWEGIIRKYINYRYSFMPMLIAAGYRAHKDGFPFVARSDLYWPGIGNSDKLNHQYMFLDDILVAPIWDAANYSERKVWVPPGNWLNVWNGEVAQGPTEITNGQPWERQPMWVRMDGGLLIMTDKPGLRVAQGDWSTLTVEAYPCMTKCTTTRTIYERSLEIDPNPSTTKVTLSTDADALITVHLGANTENLARAWTVRVNLPAGTQVISATLDGTKVEAKILHARKSDDGTPWQGYWPWQGKDSIPASKQGPVAQVSVPSSKVEHTLKVNIAKSVAACSWDGDDCRSTNCCKVTGSKCYAKSDFWATCMPDCVPGVHATSVDGKPWSCKLLGGKPDTYPTKPAPLGEPASNTSLFCFAVEMPLVPFHRDLLDAQEENLYGIHKCNMSKVYKGVKAPEGELSDVTMIPKTFVQIWKEIQNDRLWEDYDWTVKVDVDAVFLPARLAQHLRLLRPRADVSIYIKNSEKYGMAGPLMVMSNSALKTYFDNEDDCSKALGQFGEDFYFATCFDAIGVGFMFDDKMLKNFNEEATPPTENTQVCAEAPFAAFYPYKRQATWTSCYEQADVTIVESLKRYEVSAMVKTLDSKFTVMTLLVAGAAIGAAAAAVAFVRRAAVRRTGRVSPSPHPHDGLLLPQEEQLAD
jgi:hypothetical protein